MDSGGVGGGGVGGGGVGGGVVWGEGGSEGGGEGSCAVALSSHSAFSGHARCEGVGGVGRGRVAVGLRQAAYARRVALSERRVQRAWEARELWTACKV